VPKVKCARQVRLDNPLKQGLKLRAVYCYFILYGVRLDNPLKQGLKLYDAIYELLYLVSAWTIH